MKRDSVIFYRSFYEAIKELPLDVQSLVYNAIFEYSLDFNEAVLTGLPKTIFTLIKPQLDANNKRFENGSKGGRKKQKETKSESKHNQSETKDKANNNVNNNNNNNDNNNEKENDFNLTAILNSDYLAVLELWLQHKKERKEKYKPTGLKTLAEKIKADYKTIQDFENAVKYSISNNWAGIYPPKPQNNQTANTAAPKKMVY